MTNVVAGEVTRRRAVALSLVLLALAACRGGGGRAAVTAHPPLWRVSDGDTTIWLLGGIHMLPAGVRWRSPAVERAITESGELVLESSPDDRADFAAIAGGEGLPPLADRVPPDLRPALAAAVARAGTTAGMLDQQKSWAAAVLIATGDAAAHGATTRDGVDRLLWDAFAGRRRAAFYRTADQLRMLDALPADLQDRMLADAIDPRQDYASAFRAWASGDIAALARVSADTPLAGRLIGQPNAAWSRWIAARMRRPGIVLVAVGTGHLAGPYALPAMLARHGLRVERVDGAVF